ARQGDGERTKRAEQRRCRALLVDAAFEDFSGAGDAEDRQVAIEAASGAGERPHDPSPIAGGAYHERELRGGGELAVGEVEERPASIRRPSVLAAACPPEALAGWRPADEREPLPDRLGVRPQPSRQRFIDDDDRDGAAPIAVAELASLDEWNPE